MVATATVSVPINGAAAASSIDPLVELGMQKPMDGAYFLNNDAVYSNAKVWASVAP